MNNISKKKFRRNFIYCVPNEDNYAGVIFSRLIRKNLKKYPNSKHLIYPIFGIKYDGSLTSRYPKYIGKLYWKFLYLPKYFFNELKINKETRKQLSLFLSARELDSLEFISCKKWFKSLIKAKLIWKKYDNKNIDLFIKKFRLKNIYAGDLIGDTYLRFKNTPKINLKDWFFKDVIWRAFAIENLFENLIQDKVNEKYYLFGTYSTYINHGIPLRIACKKNIIAITLGQGVNSEYLLHKNIDNGINPSHSGYHHKYTIKKANLLGKETILKAKKSLSSRCQDIYDSSMAYMQNENPKVIQNNMRYSSIKGNRVLMLHDFFDSPHTYNWMIFPDFWTWAYETLLYCHKNQIILNIKPHPNQRLDSKKIVKEFKKYFKDSIFINWLPSTIKNSKLFKQKPSLIISVYGSIAAEATFMKIPVLLAGDHPAINFKIANTAINKKIYFKLLSNPKLNNLGSRKNAILFTALHHRNVFENKNLPLFHLLKKWPDYLHKDIELLTDKKSIKYIDKSISKIQDEID